jgi:hypothetical protein
MKRTIYCCFHEMYDIPRMKLDTLQVKFTRLREIGMFQKHCVRKVKLNEFQKFNMSQENLAVLKGFNL